MREKCRARLSNKIEAAKVLTFTSKENMSAPIGNLLPTQPSTETPILEILKRFEARMGQLAVDTNLKFGRLQIEVGGFRSQLAKIFGADHPALQDFPKLEPGSLQPHQVPEAAARRLAHVRSVIQRLEAVVQPAEGPKKRVFFGHGRSAVWRELKDFVQDRLHVEWDEFNSESVAGLATSERLSEMLERAGFAFLIMTAEDEMADGSAQARPNVIHEIGLFQGKLGMRRAIILLEDGCAEFSNIIGLSQIRFPRGRVSACFEDIRQVLAREGIIVG